ncbi:MAG TPA: prepilin-type N-terminal cleavage/methylation domain-containing protein [Haliangium sp.]|nr:prepilin-type N-terminal cleavage/methylation domain-containing protein [Haliangium sp.]
MRSRQAGFTLIEMMIVVAIMGILAGLAVFAYRKVTSSAEVDSEVNAIFAEFRVRQEEFHAENGAYLSTGANETVTFPPGAPRRPQDAPVDIAPLLLVDGSGGTPADMWVRLRMNPRKNHLRCAYVAVADVAGVAAGGLGGGVLGMNNPTAPESNWYFLVARCDADGDPAQDSFYLARHDREDVLIQNKGK